MDFARLPPEIHLVLFSYLTLSELISIRAVNRTLHAIVRMVLYDVRTLHIFGDSLMLRSFAEFTNEHMAFNTNDDDDDHFFFCNKAESIILSHHRPKVEGHFERRRIFSPSRFRFFADFVPRVTKLGIHLMPDEFSKVPLFDFFNLYHWEEQLESLTIDMAFYCHLNEEQRRVFWAMITRMSSLRQLHLFNLNGENIPLMQLRQIRHHLEQLTLHGCGNTRENLQQLGSPLTHLQMDWLPNWNMTQQQWWRLARFAVSITHLTIMKKRINHWVLDYLQNCKSIIHLDISQAWLTNPCKRLMFQLKSLELHSLAICQSFLIHLQQNVRKSEERRAFYPTYYQDRPPKFAPLFSVRILKIDHREMSLEEDFYTEHWWYRQLADLYPNLRELIIYGADGCNEATIRTVTTLAMQHFGDNFEIYFQMSETTVTKMEWVLNRLMTNYDLRLPEMIQAKPDVVN